MEARKIVIARRELKLGEDWTAIRGGVNILIYMPEQQEGAWQCEFHIEGLLESNSKIEGKSRGEDSFEAILNAMQQIALNVYNSEAHRSGELWWLEKAQGYGLPLLAQFADLANPNVKPMQILHVL